MASAITINSRIYAWEGWFDMKPDETTFADSRLREFQATLHALARPASFPIDAGVREAGISVVQTHASAVLLTATRAYKLKKPVDLGFLDYSTPERRRRMCLEECAVNAALAPGVYLGVAPILQAPGAPSYFGPTFSAEQAPDLGARLDEFSSGAIADFAVVMRRLPDNRSLAALVAAGETNAPLMPLMRTLAGVIARFHAGAARASAEPPYIAVDDTLANVYQTVEQARSDIGVTLSAEDYASISRFITDFSVRRRALLVERLRDGRVRDGHGDLRMEHIYVAPFASALPDTRKMPASDLIIIDRIEFDKRFRIGDVAGDVAFLAVEMEAAGRGDLARAFVRSYIVASGDTGALELLPFYKAYRALVRGKVRSLFAAQPGVAGDARLRASDEAARMYALAARYASSPTRPTVVLIGGLMGAGKSTLARALSRETGWQAQSSDITRKRLAGLPLTATIEQAGRRGLYSSSWDSRVYERLRSEANALLSTGYSVILDASFVSRARRGEFAKIASAAGAHIVFIECVCPREVALARLAKRWQTKVDGKRRTDAMILASDGRPDLYDMQAQRWQPFDPRREPSLSHIIIDTTLSRPRQLKQALSALMAPDDI